MKSQILETGDEIYRRYKERVLALNEDEL